MLLTFYWLKPLIFIANNLFSCIFIIFKNIPKKQPRKTRKKQLEKNMEGIEMVGRVIKNFVVGIFSLMFSFYAMLVFSGNEVKYFSDDEKYRMWIAELEARKESYVAMPAEFLSCIIKLSYEDYSKFPFFNEREFKKDLNELIFKIHGVIPQKERVNYRGELCGLSFEGTLQELMKFDLDISRELREYFQNVKSKGYVLPFNSKKIIL